MSYNESLELLLRLKQGGMRTKSGVMLGLGESKDEVLETMEHDKKRKDDLIHFVLLKRIGKTTIRKDLDSKLLARVWNKVLLTNPSLSAG